MTNLKRDRYCQGCGMFKSVTVTGHFSFLDEMHGQEQTSTCVSSFRCLRTQLERIVIKAGSKNPA